MPPLAPLARGTLDLPVDFEQKAGREYLLTVSFALRQATRWAGKGWVVARDQIPYGGGYAPAAVPAKAVAPVGVDGGFALEAGGVRAVLSRTTGTLSELVMDGRTILKDVGGLVRGPRLTVMRALTDNDVWMRGRGADPADGLGFGTVYQSGLTQLRYHVRRLSADESGVRAVVEVNGAKGAGFLHAATWRLSPDGALTMANEVRPFGRMPKALPRLGLSLQLEEGLESFAWYGRGPQENYVDRCSGAFLGLYRSTVTDQYVAYARPQDNGCRGDVRWAELTDADGRGVRVSGSVPLFVQALHYSWEDLEFARHRAGQQRILNLKPPRREVCLNLDVRQTGLGGNSCGPLPEAAYRFPVRDEAWTVTFAPSRARLCQAAQALSK